MSRLIKTPRKLSSQYAPEVFKNTSGTNYYYYYLAELEIIRLPRLIRIVDHTRVMPTDFQYLKCPKRMTHT